jgi:phage gp46-like protein
MNNVKFTHFSLVNKSPERSQTFSRQYVYDSMHERTAGSRNTLSRNQQLLKTISSSANAIAGSGMTWREIDSVSLKKSVKMSWLVWSRLTGCKRYSHRAVIWFYSRRHVNYNFLLVLETLELVPLKGRTVPDKLYLN